MASFFHDFTHLIDLRMWVLLNIEEIKLQNLLLGVQRTNLSSLWYFHINILYIYQWKAKTDLQRKKGKSCSIEQNLSWLGILIKIYNHDSSVTRWYLAERTHCSSSWKLSKLNSLGRLWLVSPSSVLVEGPWDWSSESPVWVTSTHLAPKHTLLRISITAWPIHLVTFSAKGRKIYNAYGRYQ